MHGSHVMVSDKRTPLPTHLPQSNSEAIEMAAQRQPLKRTDSILPDILAKKFKVNDKAPRPSKESDKWALRPVKHWYLDQNTTVYVGPFGVRFVNLTTSFALTTDEWFTWTQEWNPDEYNIVLGIDSCIAIKTGDETQLFRQDQGGFQLDNKQLEVLKKRARYINDHVGILKECEPSFNLMFQIISDQLIEVSKQLGVIPTSSWSQDYRAFELVHRNAFSMGIVNCVMAKFKKALVNACLIDAFSMPVYCLFQHDMVKMEMDEK